MHLIEHLNREMNQKYPSAEAAFSPQRPEFEIVGAFATDPLNITNSMNLVMEQRGSSCNSHYF